jgi:hypothetical protein
VSDPGAGRDEDDFGVQLEWPADAGGDPFDLPDRDASEPSPPDEPAAPPPPVDDPSAWRPPPPEPRYDPPPRIDPAPSMGPALTSLPAGAEGLGPLLAAVAARVDALSTVTVTFRNLMSDHVAHQGQRLESALREQAVENEEHRRRQDEAMRQLREELRGIAAEVRQLTAAVQAGASGGQGDLRATLTELLDEVRSLRRRTPVRPRGQGALDADQVQAMAQAVAEALQAGSARPAPSRRPRKST